MTTARELFEPSLQIMYMLIFHLGTDKFWALNISQYFFQMYFFIYHLSSHSRYPNFCAYSLLPIYKSWYKLHRNLITGQHKLCKSNIDKGWFYYFFCTILMQSNTVSALYAILSTMAFHPGIKLQGMLFFLVHKIIFNWHIAPKWENHASLIFINIGLGNELVPNRYKSIA